MTSKKQLHDLFAEFRAVKSVKIITDNLTKHPRGFALLKWQGA
ncbi:hypothetical protein SIO70_02995 [Chitinophaga sancti]|nr:hypothetical protein [Chitinophaga sancti]WPQ63824.1 hypothetical protein SIO70_02995 [Chitinophaga sancti]